MNSLLKVVVSFLPERSIVSQMVFVCNHDNLHSPEKNEAGLLLLFTSSVAIAPTSYRAPEPRKCSSKSEKMPFWNPL